MYRIADMSILFWGSVLRQGTAIVVAQTTVYSQENHGTELRIRNGKQLVKIVSFDH